MLEALGIFFLLFGAFFCAMGVIGNIRLPDVFTRLHATSKVSLMGIVGLLLASALLLPESAPKAVALGILVIFSAPVASQVIARAAYRDGCDMVGLLQNDLAVQYIDFPYSYTIGEPVPWIEEQEEEAPLDFGDADLPAEPTEMETETEVMEESTESEVQ
jgi:monovalent cation/proton antiporter, MnhG/PhaG subunit